MLDLILASGWFGLQVLVSRGANKLGPLNLDGYKVDLVNIYLKKESKSKET